MGTGLVLLLLAMGSWVVSNIRERARTHEAGLGGPEIAKFAMWAFIGTECIIFGALIANMIYLWMRNPEINVFLHHLDTLLVVSVNTFFLLTSSLCVVLGLSAIQRGDRMGLARWLGGTALLGGAFLGIQAYEYSKLFAEGLSLTSTAEFGRYGSGFFFLTGFHGLHVFVGVLWALVLIINTLRGGFKQDDHMGVEVWGLYWHFVDVVWIFIFTLVYLI
jgi:cytochrome c oxidase subunit 3/cytochrome o ubiquinol oxidase subunit 3